MKRRLLDALTRARAEKRRTALITRLDDGEQALLIDGEIAEGGLIAPSDVLEGAEAALRADKGRTVEAGDGRSYFVQIFNPPLRLLCVGAVHIAQALSPIGAGAGYEVTVIDPRGAWGSAERFPGMTVDDRWPDEALEGLAPDRRTAICALTHDPKLDDPALVRALRSEAFYVGALGSKKTHAKRVERLTEAGLSDAEIARIAAPIGLDIGAVSPAEIAISVMAQITLALRGAKGR